jgi:hypothetical protein
MPHQVLEQVVDNVTRIEGQAQHNTALNDETIHLAQHNSAIMDETLRLREETAQLRAELLARPSSNDFITLQAQVANLCATLQQSRTPTLKVNQPREFKGLPKDQGICSPLRTQFRSCPWLVSH